MNKIKTGLATLLLMLPVLLPACASSTTGPGAGAAQAVVKGSPADVSQRAQNVFQQMNIQMTGSSVQDAGKEQQLTGRLGDSDVTVKMDTAANSTTNVEVDAKRNAFNGNSDLAKNILTRIVQLS